MQQSLQNSQLTLEKAIKEKHNLTGIHSNTVKSSNEQPSIIQLKFSKINKSYSRTLKALNFHLLNSSTCKEPGVPCEHTGNHFNTGR